MALVSVQATYRAYRTIVFHIENGDISYNRLTEVPARPWRIKTVVNKVSSGQHSIIDNKNEEQLHRQQFPARKIVNVRRYI